MKLSEFNEKLEKLKTVIENNNHTTSKQIQKWQRKYDKIIEVANQIFGTGYDGELTFFIPDADIMKFCNTELKQSRGSHISLKIYQEEKSDGYEMMTVKIPVFKEPLSFSGSIDVTFQNHTEALLDYVLEQISKPEYIQELINEVE